MAGSIGYQVRIRVQGELSATWWRDVFAGLVLASEPGGTTVLSGELPDQAALHGLLVAIRDLGLSLISVESEASPSAVGEGR